VINKAPVEKKVLTRVGHKPKYNFEIPFDLTRVGHKPKYNFEIPFD